MVVAKFYFRALKNSLSVHVKNLEALSVEQIQDIESFVKARKGVFDFQTYTFVLQKRLEFEEFSRLIKIKFPQSLCIEESIEEIPRDRIGFGLHKGMYYEELPDSYLIWLKTNYLGKERETLLKEVDKRGL